MEFSNAEKSGGPKRELRSDSMWDEGQKKRPQRYRINSTAENKTKLNKQSEIES